MATMDRSPLTSSSGAAHSGAGMGNMSSSVQDFVSGVSEQAGELKHRSEKYLQDGWAKTCDYVRANPGKTILFSAAAGLVIGGLLLRRR